MITILTNQEKVLAYMHVGDTRCAIAITDRVRKKARDEDDSLPLGLLGTVSGNSFVPEWNSSVYLVVWDGLSGEAFTREEKIEKI